MEKIKLKQTNIETSKLGLGTWAIGGFQWGGSDEQEAVKTIHAAFDKGIRLIDTAPSYGFGKAEELIGKALQSAGLNRSEITISTKTGLNWNEKGELFRDSTKSFIHKDVERSLRNLKTDYIDVYHVQWPDTLTPFHHTAEALNYLYKEGKIRAIGLSNFTTEQMDIFREAAPIHAIQVPHNLFERSSEDELLPYAENNEITTFFYSSLTRGLLSGQITENTHFPEGDVRRATDPKFQQPRFEQYMKTVNELNDLAQDRFQKNVLELALRWNLQQPGENISLWGARHPDQLSPMDGLWDFSIDDDTIKDIDEILMRSIHSPIGTEFMAPPNKQELYG
ncbi:aldo/keto reductase [Virgibacillus senegalensis]|uniref:aldo/keto reductase n=1 Tax=Virgibacillus senegalensis TaxID=1499679 RepID=UPI00069EABA3|nr:aldo/keto reductase [Virgibacillus senegalensis]